MKLAFPPERAMSFSVNLLFTALPLEVPEAAFFVVTKGRSSAFWVRSKTDLIFPLRLKFAGRITVTVLPSMDASSPSIAFPFSSLKEMELKDPLLVDLLISALSEAFLVSVTVTSHFASFSPDFALYREVLRRCLFHALLRTYFRFPFFHC